MSAPRHPAILDELRQRIGRIAGQGPATGGAIPFGVASIDRHLPSGGLALGALHEVIGGADDLTHGASAALFIAGVIARLKGPVLWCLRQRDLFAPGLAGAGLHPDRVIYAEAGNARTVLLVMEEGLRHRGLAGVVGELDRAGLTPSRRLQLAAEASNVPAFLLRRWQRLQDAGKAEATAAATRWRISAVPSPAYGAAGVGRACWHLELLRCRNGGPASWIVEACDEWGYLAPGDLAVPADLADGPVETPGRRRHTAT